MELVGDGAERLGRSASGLPTPRAYICVYFLCSIYSMLSHEAQQLTVFTCLCTGASTPKENTLLTTPGTSARRDTYSGESVPACPLLCCVRNVPIFPRLYPSNKIHYLVRRRENTRIMEPRPGFIYRSDSFLLSTSTWEVPFGCPQVLKRFIFPPL